MLCHDASVAAAAAAAAHLVADEGVPVVVGDVVHAVRGEGKGTPGTVGVGVVRPAAVAVAVHALVVDGCSALGGGRRGDGGLLSVHRAVGASVIEEISDVDEIEIIAKLLPVYSFVV